jgi:hypothetical protein
MDDGRNEEIHQFKRPIDAVKE